MQVETLTCNNCGAPLDVPASANFATCAHCGSRLAIKRNDSAVYTEVLSAIKADTAAISQQTATISAHTGQISGDVTAIRLQNNLAQLDRDWQVRAGQFVQRDGKMPDIGAATARVVLGLVAAIVGVTVIFSNPKVAWLGWLLAGAGVIMLLNGWASYRVAAQYKASYNAYARARTEILSRLSGH